MKYENIFQQKNISAFYIFMVKNKRSQKHQKPQNNYILRDISIVYTIPINDGVVDNIVSFPDDIEELQLKTLLGKRIFKGDILVFTSKTAKPEDLLIIEIIVDCERQILKTDNFCDLESSSKKLKTLE